MKGFIASILILLGFHSAKSQDLIRELQKLTLENDSLKKQVIYPLRDSIIRFKALHTAEIEKYSIRIRALENEKNDLNEKLKKKRSPPY